jgi:hypothetical protein
LAGDERYRSDEQRVAVFGSTGGVFSADGGARARFVLNNNLLANERCCAPVPKTRAVISAADPGVNPTMTWIGRDG